MRCGSISSSDGGVMESLVEEDARVRRARGG